jgi:hypothetical protein
MVLASQGKPASDGAGKLRIAKTQSVQNRDDPNTLQILRTRPRDRRHFRPHRYHWLTKRPPSRRSGRFLKIPIQFSNSLTVIASEAKQFISRRKERMDCFVALLLAMTLI